MINLIEDYLFFVVFVFSFEIVFFKFGFRLGRFKKFDLQYFLFYSVLFAFLLLMFEREVINNFFLKVISIICFSIFIDIFYGIFEEIKKSDKS